MTAGLSSAASADAAARPSAPWHLWLMGAVGLLLHAIAARDLVETVRMSQTYFAERGYGPAQVEYFTDYPVALHVVAGCTVVAGGAAAVLLMLRRRWAAPAALVAVVGQLAMLAATVGLLDRWQVLGPRSVLSELVVAAWMVAFWLAARHHRRRGVLR
ncbi:hypothetical protein [Nesterenkonia sp. F]|uniref:hypothetical protein n=1 Tax=Nesterenkonia sp. F TaxID=795955 RepID=UPI000495080A|nr:hypothetical protein [Nesterenkonia sp. F]